MPRHGAPAPIGGAASLLAGFGQLSLFCSRVEAAQLDPSLLDGAMLPGQEALTALRDARDRYQALTELVEVHGTSPLARLRLARFDYDLFARRWGLDPVVVEEIAGLVGKGEMTPFFARMEKRTQRLIEQLETAVARAQSDEPPTLEAFIEIAHQRARLEMLGQYGALLFSTALPQVEAR